MTYRLLMSLVALGAASCSYTASFNPSPYVDHAALERLLAARPEQSSEGVELLEHRPHRPYVVLGTVDAPNIEWTAHYDVADLLAAMRREAARRGADALIDFRTQDSPVWAVVGTRDTGQTPVRFKGLHAWAEAILYTSEEERRALKPE